MSHKGIETKYFNKKATQQNKKPNLPKKDYAAIHFHDYTNYWPTNKYKEYPKQKCDGTLEDEKKERQKRVSKI